MSKLYAKAPAFFAALVIACGLTGCGQISITSVGLLAALELNKGETSQLGINYGVDKDDATEEAINEAAEKLALVWASSDEAVAVVDENGNVTAIDGGEATITVSVDGTDIQSSCKVSVTVPLEALKAEAEMQLYINGANAEDGYTDSKMLDITLVPADADNVELIYESTDESVATVDENGVLTAVANGKTTITVKSGDISTEVEVTVYTVPSAFYAQDMELTVGTSGKLEVEIEGEDVNFGTDFTYSSDDENVATVDEDGVVTAVGEGNVQITVQSETGAASAAIVRVTPKPAPTATTNRGNGNASNGNSGGSTGSSGGDDAVETVGPAPAPAPQPEPTPAPAPEQPYCPLCKEYGHSGCYHGNGSDTGTCPVCGVGYSTWHEEILLNPETNPELYC
ncbi:MAG: hypothetical protein HDT26_05750 [Subdoligranulum sp.]|nr:hypothetical protein [Subdoligranulum sp.]